MISFFLPFFPPIYYIYFGLYCFIIHLFIYLCVIQVLIVSQTVSHFPIVHGNKVDKNEVRMTIIPSECQTDTFMQSTWQCFYSIHTHNNPDIRLIEWGDLFSQ